MNYELYISADAIADANGKAIARLQPLRANERWHIRRMTIQSDSSTLVPKCRIYRGAESPSRQVDGSETGTMDHSDTDLRLQNGEVLLAVWEGADVGASCLITVEGETSR
jgi:hypothetical protein